MAIDERLTDELSYCRPLAAEMVQGPADSLTDNRRG